MKAGTYKVKAKGHGSSFMPMEVTLSDDATVSYTHLTLPTIA